MPTPEPVPLPLSEHYKHNPHQTFYEAVGGEDTFRAIVHNFYQQMRSDDLIGPMYPHDDWEGAEDRLRWFLAQYWGGPQTFSQERGHPRLRMRHAHFSIGEQEAKRWLELMDNAIATIDEDTLSPVHRAAMREHMTRVAHMLINRH
ncbi:globin [Corynebacterium sp. sy017]|uniref:globin n=1 Tax=unclassified Corynebacterium TaxID=2624378 RepID=UPI001186C058|nr:MULTISPECIES: globin [unclassified Corynebacterium]MBP3088198.1 globin [Corynebacterium sp. sy017]QDZ43127.1 globin [Corynebacterium sp. sy039]TSD92700.1 globin [Corynebacterium sp. SY003]